MVNGTTEKAHTILQSLIENGFIIRVKDNRNRFEPDLSRFWSDDASYAWVYEKSNLTNGLLGIGVVMAAFAFILMPLWPRRLRSLTWYLTMLVIAFLAFLIITAIIRIIIYVLCLILTPNRRIWIFPNLFEDCGFFESFVPAYIIIEKDKEVKSN